jgi:2,3-dihydroxybenzoate decarboxylase
MEAMGSDRVMFSVDYPFEKTDAAVRFLDGANILETERVKVASENARRIFHLDRRIG